MNDAKCKHCGKGYRQRVDWQKYCSTPCRIAAWAAREQAKVKKEDVK